MLRSAPHLSKLKGTVISLALVAGYVDGYGLRALKNYVSFMSGNTTFAGLQVGRGNLSAALPPGLAIIGFLAGSFVGSWIAHSDYRYAKRVLFAIAICLLAVFIVFNFYHSLNIYLGILILSSSMGLLNPAVSRVGTEPLSLTFVTGTLNKIGGHLALAARRKLPSDAEGTWDTHLYRALLEASVWAGFLAGAVLSGLAASYFERLELLPACVALIVIAFVSPNT